MLSKYKFFSKNILGIHQKMGRNNQGKITVKHRGGGHLKLYRKINWYTTNFIENIILNVEYDPNRSSYIARLFSKCKLSLKSYITYIVCPLSIKNFDSIDNNSHTIGNSWNIEFLNIGDIIFNLEIYPTKGPVLIRSAGVFGQILQKYCKKKGYAIIKLPSGEQRLIKRNCKASLGRVSKENYRTINWLKAGKSRWLNKRPHVRGVAMNPIDHPHGGGEGKTSGGRPSVSFKGRLTKGVPTRRKKNMFVLKNRK